MEVPRQDSRPSHQSLPVQGGPSPISSSDSIQTDDITPLRRNTMSGQPGHFGGGMRRQSIGFPSTSSMRRQSIGVPGPGAGFGAGRRQSIGPPGLGMNRRQSIGFPSQGGGRRQSIMMAQNDEPPSGMMRRQSLAQGNPETSFSRRGSLMVDITPLEMLQRAGVVKRQSTQYDDFLKDFQFESEEHKIDEEDEEDEDEDTEIGSDVSQIERKKKAKSYGSAKGMKFTSEFHALMFKYTESRLFTVFIMGIILINTIMLVAQTWLVVTVRASWYFAAADNVFLGVYIMEVVLKLYVWKAMFFKEGWNILDFSIVAFNLVDFALPMIVSNLKGFNGAAIFRLLRVFRAVKAIRALRVLRTIRFLANLQVIMTTLLHSIRSIGAIVMLITLTMYMFAVIGRGLYSELDPEHFGSLFEAIFTLFQLLTLDDWFEIYKKISSKGREHIILYLMLYIIAEYFIFLNLFVAVLVDNFQLSLEAAAEVAKEKKRNEVEEDENDMYGLEDLKSKSTTSQVSEDNKGKEMLSDLYPGHAESDLSSLGQYFRILASVEYNSMILGKQQRILDMMVDICADANDDV